ncbi:DNA-directed DNA polymerase [Anopheles sinensis]|uniref:DNA-directed DNA polymerase n=1 Tax=Anopheles sinensis TaxID=74873 RepID=A0A084VVW4_ANOSI|nr:DNA-directed DNA polymerase [Anopheles sinensis]
MSSTEVGMVPAKSSIKLAHIKGRDATLPEASSVLVNCFPHFLLARVAERPTTGEAVVQSEIGARQAVRKFCLFVIGFARERQYLPAGSQPFMEDGMPTTNTYASRVFAVSSAMLSPTVFVESFDEPHRRLFGTTENGVALTPSPRLNRITGAQRPGGKDLSR